MKHIITLSITNTTTTKLAEKRERECEENGRRECEGRVYEEDWRKGHSVCMGLEDVLMMYVCISYLITKIFSLL